MALADHDPRYEGSFIVELWRDAKTDFVPKTAIVSNNKVFVDDGSVQQVMGGIQLYSHGEPFSFGYHYLKRITGRGGEILWKNWDIEE
jgi:hypothetical protein